MSSADVDDSEGAALPLEGVQVVDFTHFVAGPWCTMLLADLGAEVVKVEPPRVGEIGRRMGAVYQGPHSAIYLAFNRNKRSVELDLKQPQGRETAHRLMTAADVVVQNFRPSVAPKLQMDATGLLDENPKLVYCAISAFGQTGPYAGRPGNDPIVQALSGAMLLGREQGERPLRMAVSLPDFAAGVMAALSIISALVRRRRTGSGALLELNLLDAELFAQVDHVLSLVLNRSAENGAGRPELPVRGPSEALRSRPGITARVEMPDVGRLEVLRTPVRAAPAWPVAHVPPPALGADTAAVLGELGYSAGEIETLRVNGVVGESRGEDRYCYPSTDVGEEG